MIGYAQCAAPALRTRARARTRTRTRTRSFIPLKF